MRLPRIPLLPLVFLATACSHTAPQNQPASPTYRAALAKAFQEKAELQGIRRPASARRSRQARLRKVQPGRIRVFVFPKLRALNAKNASESAPLYKSEAEEEASFLGPPEEYEVSSLALSPCQQFLEKNLSAKYHPKAFFDPALARDKARQCAIVEITSLKVKNADKALIRRDDLLRVRLYLDDNFVTYGYELDKYQDSRTLETVQIRIDGMFSASSGLSLMPMDIPSLRLLSSSLARAGTVDPATKIDKLAIAQIRRKLMRNFAPARCKGALVRYADAYGADVEVGWCDNASFPQYISNSRFVAVTQAQ